MNILTRRLPLLATLVLCGFSSARAEVPVPLSGSVPLPIERVRQDNPSVLPLKGTWKFQLTHGAVTSEGYQGQPEGPATASSSQSGHEPNDALDFVSGLPALATTAKDKRWCADGDTFPQTWAVDLGRAENVSALSILWESPDVSYRFRVEGSTNRKNWTLLADRSAPPGAGNGELAIKPATMRYLRIVILGASRKGAWASIRRVDVSVARGGQQVLWTPPPAAPQANQDSFARPDYQDAGWASMAVPGNWEMAGFSRPTYDNPDNAVGLYRRQVLVPASFAGKRVLWHFDGVFDGAEIWVNGQKMGYHESGYTAFDIDVTSALKPGARNLLAVRVSKNTFSVDLDTGDYWSLGGIYRENYLLALPQTHIQSTTITTDLDAAYKNATLNATVNLSGAPGSNVRLQGTLFRRTSGGSERVANVSFEGSGTIGADGSGQVALSTQVLGPRLWSAEKPNLYYLVLSLARNNTLVERVQERFGFRKIEITNGVLRWNGVPIKCAGSDRHEEWAAYGHALGEAQWRTDLALMKGANINAIRTSHYNHAARFLELCDEVGMYVLDEVPACWCDVKDPKLLPAFLLRARETLARDKNKPCVMAWSLGNESGYGPNNEAMLDYVKANDPTRPALISQCGPWNNPKLDFADYHYPDLNGVRGIASDKARQTVPAILTEQPHIFYVQGGLDYDFGEKDLWGQILASNWSVVWPTDSIAGSYIWEWQDQGLADKFLDKNGVGPDGLRQNNHKGIVDGFRNPKPEYWNIKMVYSPVTTAAREVRAQGSKYLVPLQNRYSFTNLDELSCHWQALRGAAVVASGLARVQCAPRSSVQAAFPVTPNADTLRLEFVHSDGRSVYSTRLHVSGTPLRAAPAPLPAAGTLSLLDAGGQVTISTAGTRLVVDKASGLMSWQRGAQAVIASGPILNLGEARVNEGDHGARDFLFSKSPPQLRNAQVSSRMSGQSAHIEVTSDVYLTESPQLKAQLSYTLDVRPDAQADFAWKLNWLGDDANAWELGLKLLLPARYDRLRWSRRGLWTEYPQGHIGANDGSVTARDISFRSTKRDVRWAQLSSTIRGAGSGLAVLSASDPLHTRARTEAEGTTLFLSSQVAPPYDFSTNLRPDLLIHLKKGQPQSGSFGLRLTNGAAQ